MASAQDLELRIDTNDYSQRIGTIEGYIQKLQTIYDQYSAKKSEIDSIRKDDEAEEYKNTVENNMQKVQTAIDAAREQIETLQKTIAAKESTKANVQNIVNDAAAIAKNVFG